MCEPGLDWFGDVVAFMWFALFSFDFDKFGFKESCVFNILFYIPLYCYCFLKYLSEFEITRAAFLY